ncbi:MULTISPECIES: trypco2 family protein [unclassified Streptomyces]|uniref:trypco2 family protein n=1 Tax=unclassified Streptomyces TaxID=2593676 RepID=UPI0011CE7361|nr:trypco2 family protein [Streptomyces sp. or43]TXS36666.1 hypothetical protein EAO72_24790 [Streptomyces sp. or43]
MSSESWSGLAEAVGAIRAELQQAMKDGKDEDLKFTAGPVEMEFAVEIKKNGEARTKVMVLPWTAEVRGGLASTRTHRLKVTLQPVDLEGNDARISNTVDERPA